ncbi:CUB and sushi domain-containing protein 3-like [Sycon ciliatum]|uniref:CUB and sushi domain-containing protein 3-like n=1 Tax=Sycon ciliatum TaxID=27933 RepID=UPI0031F6558F
MLTCDCGYTAYGSTTAICGEDGQVTGANGACSHVSIASMPCTRPSDPDNGAYSRGAFTIMQNTLTLTCNSGYQLSGSATVSCGVYGQVTGANGTCNLPIANRTCTRPTNPANGAYSTGAFTAVQNTLMLTCDGGYQADGSTVATCGADGQVTGVNGTCARKFLSSL